MKKVVLVLALVCASAGLVGCVEGLPPVKIDKRPLAADYGRIRPPLLAIPKFNADSANGWQVDLRSMDLSKIDAQGALADLMYADFDDKTLWPPRDKLPVGFDHQAIMDLGEDPGLGVRSLHALGITGKGVGVAIIDQTLLVDHVEYADRLRLYEENGENGESAAMHAPAVASIAVGKSVGVAPGADLYFIACSLGSPGGSAGWTYDFTMLANSVRRILQVNEGLPAERKIRVLSISVGWASTQKGYAEITAAVNEAKKAGILVVSSSLQETFGFAFHALGRDPMADPNVFDSFTPGMFLAKQFYLDDPKSRSFFATRLWIPMDSRTTASPTGNNDYVFYREGGWSWCIPYIAGTYALACQVEPKITPDLFWQTALQTGKTVKVQNNGKAYSLGPIIDPVALIETLQGK
jgi:hypothetical protein